MNVYIGTITETYKREVAILADSEFEANQILENLYRYGDIDELDSSDWDHWDTEIDKIVDVHSSELDDITIYDERGLEYNKEDIEELKRCGTL